MVQEKTVMMIMIKFSPIWLIWRFISAYICANIGLIRAVLSYWFLWWFMVLSITCFLARFIKEANVSRWLLSGASVLFFCTACSPDEKIGVSYHAYNHTDEHIVSIVINGEGGILDASAHGEGSGVCCVVLPKRWRPGLMATIKWRMEGDWLRDENGKEVFRDGKKVLVPGDWKEKTVEVPKYESTKGMGDFYIHFFPDDEVEVLVNYYGARHPSHPYPHPSGYKLKEY